jgi:hypothetical protein
MQTSGLEWSFRPSENGISQRRIILRQLKRSTHYWLVQSDRSHPPLSDAPNVNESVILNTNSATSPVTTNGRAISNGNGLTSRKSLNRDIAFKVGKDADVRSQDPQDG